MLRDHEDRDVTRMGHVEPESATPLQFGLALPRKRELQALRALAGVAAKERAKDAV
jgi:hypothetical protein